MHKKYFNPIALQFYYILFFALIAGLQILGKGADYFAYVEIFQYGRNRHQLEPFFAIFRSMNDVLFSSSIFIAYFIIDILSLSLKVWAIRKLANSYSNYLYALFFYLLSFFLLHEYVQIRASLAIGIYFVSLVSLKNNKKIQYFLLCLIALMVHYSAIVMIFFFFFQKISRNKKFYVSMVIMGFFFAIFAQKTTLGNKMQEIVYFLQNTTGVNKSGTVNDFLSVFNLKYLAFLVMYLLYAKYLNKNDGDMILFKSISLGLCFFYWLLPLRLPVISVRFAEYYISICCVFFANNMTNFPIKDKKINVFIIFVFLSFYLYATLKTIGLLGSN